MIEENPKPRVLHIGPVPPPLDGGIAAYLEGLLRSKLQQDFRLSTFDVRTSATARRFRAWRWVLTLWFLVRYVRRLSVLRPEIVHIHTSAHLGFWEKSLFGYIAKSFGASFILHIHGGDFDSFLKSMSPQKQGWARRIFSSAGAVIVLSNNWLRLFKQFVPADRLVVIPNAIHLDDFTPGGVPRRDPELRLLFIGMICQRKGLDELRQALVGLRARGLNFHLDVLGGEEFYGEHLRYRKLFQRAGLDRSVSFRGMVVGQNKTHFLQQADIFVLPSRSESFGIVNLEAMASGLPVVSTRTGAIPEYIEDGVSGMLVEPGNAKELEETLAKLMTDEDLRLRLGSAARKRVMAYDWRTVSEQIAEIYTRISGIRSPQRLD